MGFGERYGKTVRDKRIRQNVGVAFFFPTRAIRRPKIRDAIFELSIMREIEYVPVTIHTKDVGVLPCLVVVQVCILHLRASSTALELRAMRGGVRMPSANNARRCMFMVLTDSTLPLLPGLDKVLGFPTPVRLGRFAVIMAPSKSHKRDHTRATMRTHEWKYARG